MKTYATPIAFRQALEMGLRQSSGGGAGLNRARQLLVYDRFLARAVSTFADAIVLKGGLALELRLVRARTTKDIDIRVTGASGGLLNRLQAAGALDLGDFMRFEVRRNLVHPTILAPGLDYEGERFQVTCDLAGKLYGSPFGVDVAVADTMWGTPDQIEAPNRLAFVGAPATRIALLPRETHVAEKLHAYTQPRSTPNSRVKDLPDLALLATTGTMCPTRLFGALDLVFGARKTHGLPGVVPDAPAAWKQAYQKMAEVEALEWQTLESVLEAVRAFLNPVLAGTATGKWDPATWSWCLDDSALSGADG